MKLADLMVGLHSGAVRLIDLTAPLTHETPVIPLPPETAQIPGFELEELARYDERGAIWYHNAIHTGEHVGTHFDAPVHWISGRDGSDVASAPLDVLVAEAIVIDKSAEAAENPDFLLEVDDFKAWIERHGEFPHRCWVLYRTGWDARSDDAAAFLNADSAGPHTPGISPSCAEWLAQHPNVIGVGVETVGTDAGQAFTFEPAFPCHNHLLGAGKFGITQLRSVGELPARGAVLLVCPLKIPGGSGSPARILALTEATS